MRSEDSPNSDTEPIGAHGGPSATMEAHLADPRLDISATHPVYDLHGGLPEGKFK
ncbi:hypothetical protein HS1genome_0571 [Sulfodiicoccus acidiphilus]|uniref:Uncharacterized protein n=1 Tax=Sulfodiicoccus acidiphilus TaxID=1670455 RepID=A0A348B1Y0_9CREN|nr:hypothetical protein HS1genome_0571 [Sulfodiicoccus acidiphilus]GGT94400.1 hypothetical protein GCM10007116_09990 [Sulfodiicoccus acidiphilus]